MAALEKHGAAAPQDTAPAPTSQPAQPPTQPNVETPPQTPPQTPPATPEAPPAPPATKTPDEIERDIRASVEAEYRRKEDGWRGQTKKWENAATRAQEALVARERQIDDDLARMRDAAPSQQGKEYYQAAIDKRTLDRDRQAVAAEKEEIGQVRQTIQTFQQQAQEQVLRSEAKSILPGYLAQELAARGLPEEAAAEIKAIIDSPANQRFLANAPLEGAFQFIKEWGDYIDAQIPTLQTKWAQGNRAQAQQNGDHWRPTGGPGGGPSNAGAPKTMAETSGEGLAAFLSNYQG